MVGCCARIPGEDRVKTIKPGIDEEREVLRARVTELRKLCIDEWMIMSHQVAVMRQAELITALARIQAIDRAIARRKR